MHDSSMGQERMLHNQDGCRHPSLGSVCSLQMEMLLHDSMQERTCNQKDVKASRKLAKHNPWLKSYTASDLSKNAS